MANTNESRYSYEAFESDVRDFDPMFSLFVSRKRAGGWKCKVCEFDSAGSKRSAHCIFKKE